MHASMQKLKIGTLVLVQCGARPSPTDLGLNTALDSIYTKDKLTHTQQYRRRTARLAGI